MRTIRTQLIRMQVMVVGLVLMFSIFAYIFNAYKTFQTALKDSAESTSRILSNGLVPAMMFGDQKEATNILASLRAEPKIVSAEVRKDGQVYATFERAKSETFVSKTQDISNRSTQFDFEMKTPEGDFGILTLRYSTAIMYTEMRKILLIAAIVFFAGLGVSLLLATYMQKIISAPIEMLSKSMDRVLVKGDYSQISIDSHDYAEAPLEVQTLTSQYQKMMEQIQVRDKAVKEVNENLEKRVEERTDELKKTQVALAISSKMSSLGEMAAGIAHEINNPLAIISGTADLMREEIEAGELNKELILASTKKIESTALRISKIVKGLKSFSREGSSDPFEPVRVKTIIDDALELCHSRIRSHGIELKVSAISENLTIQCRATQIGQVFLNLLNNAHDAIEHLKNPWISLEVFDKDDIVEIWITDSGTGIPVEIRDKILQPFFSTKGVGKGTGLGLSISIGVIQAHHGTLFIDSECKNTRFIIRLPKIQESA